LPEHTISELRELKRFRHLVRHAYDLILREDRLRELATIVGKVPRIASRNFVTGCLTGDVTGEDRSCRI
jgi:hypothetical protein